MTSPAARLAGRLVQRVARVQDRSFSTSLVHDPEAPVLLLSPHLDDAALDCWSVLTSALDVQVVNVFAGAPAAGSTSSWDRIVGASDSAALMRQRWAEDADVLHQVGRRPSNLPLLEHPHRAYRPEPSFRAIDSAVREVTPRASHILAPVSLGTVHPDHLLLRRYALSLRVAGLPVTLYADVPYATVYGWPHWVTGAEPVAHLDVDAYWSPSLASLPSVGAARVVRLPPADAHAKLTALRRYRTQFASLDRGPIGQLSNPAVHPFEVFWDVA